MARRRATPTWRAASPSFARHPASRPQRSRLGGRSAGAPGAIRERCVAMRKGAVMKPAVERVVAALRDAGVAGDVVEFPVSTRTAADAAAAIGTTVAQIVKSLV